MRVVLCDDEMTELTELKAMAIEYLDRFASNPYTIQTYSHSAKLLFDIEDVGRADLYILDIDMPKLNGIQIAKKIKTMYPLAMVYFYTSHAEYATEGYRVEARRYLIKGGKQEYFAEAMEYACKTCETLKNDCISLPFSHDVINVPIAEIVYVKREHRKLFVFTQTRGVVQTTMSIGNLYKELSRPQFIFIDRGTILNMDYIFRTEKDRIVLFNQAVFYVSQRRMADVKKAIALYWRE